LRSTDGVGFDAIEASQFGFGVSKLRTVEHRFGLTRLSREIADSRCTFCGGREADRGPAEQHSHKKPFRPAHHIHIVL
jgi:hypothetical protein